MDFFFEHSGEAWKRHLRNELSEDCGDKVEVDDCCDLDIFITFFLNGDAAEYCGYKPSRGHNVVAESQPRPIPNNSVFKNKLVVHYTSLGINTYLLAVAELVGSFLPPTQHKASCQLGR